MKPKRSLGQNFLHSTAALSQIITAAELDSPEVGPPCPVLEIGPGKGFLTEALLKAGAQVVAVEKDDQLYPFLQEKFASEIAIGQLKLIHGDIREINLELDHYKLVANIPYNLTGEIIRRFLETKNQPEAMVLMLQKEVAERIVARDNKESLLSISVKAFGEPRYVSTVKAGSFFPVPKVDSAILAIKNISQERLRGITPEKFFALVRQGFAHKRKTLKNNLPEATATLAACKISESERAENLKLDDWLCLAKNLA
jgi:16S rRNA (adenine1518-N6/adenine1519-N6)-dimethyltransferase